MSTYKSRALVAVRTARPPAAAWSLPAVLESSGDAIRKLVIEWLGARIGNKNTRAAYMFALSKFCGFLEGEGIEQVQEIGPLDVAAYLRSLEEEGLAVSTTKQHMAAIRGLLDHLVANGALPLNNALSVRAPRQSALKGKTPILSTEEAGEFLRSIDASTIVGLRDRALIGVMCFAVARVSAAVGLNVGDVFHEERRVRLRLREKNSKRHEIICHHTLDRYLSEYMEAVGLGADEKAPLFQSIDKYTRGLSGRRLTRHKALRMVKRRARALGLKTKIGCHSWRGTGITAYLLNGGTIEAAQQLAAHSSIRTTTLYDRRRDLLSLDEVVKINIRG